MSDRSVSLKKTDDGHRATFWAMGSPCDVLFESTNRQEVTELAKRVASEAWRVEDKFSRYLPGNVIASVNGANGIAVDVDTETAALLNFADELYRLSAGAFDITSGALRRVWTFDGSGRVPSRKEVATILANIGWQKAIWDGSTIKLRRGMEIDLGGIGKEYAVDSACQLVTAHSDLSCMINFGGDIAVTRPPKLRPAWRIGIDAAPVTQATRTIGTTNSTPGAAKSVNVIELQAGAIATSGDTRRFVLKQGKRYGHILDPRTGFPVENSPDAVTVVAKTCVQAGMLCTLAMLQGRHAERFLRAQDEMSWCRRGEQFSKIV